MIKARIPKLQGLIADVWVSERHNSELEITSNPVEFGASVTDHFFNKPKSLSVTFAVTNTPLRNNASFGSKDRVSDARDKLTKLQSSGELLEVDTISGGRYENCLIKSIAWSTDSTNPNSVNFDIELTELVIVRTKITTYEPLPADEKTADKASTDKKRGEVNAQSRDDANAKRSMTADANASADEQAKAEAARAQAEKIAQNDNRTLLKKIKDKFL